MVLFILLWAAIFTILGITIGTQNGTTLVNVSLLSWTFHDIPLTIVLIETFAIGVFFTIIVAVIDQIRLKNRLWKSTNEIKKYKEELTSLRNFPVEDVVVAQKEKTEDEKKDEKKELK